MFKPLWMLAREVKRKHAGIWIECVWAEPFGARVWWVVVKRAGVLPKDCMQIGRHRRLRKALKEALRADVNESIVGAGR